MSDDKHSSGVDAAQLASAEYDCEEIYDSQIEPLLRQVREICVEHGMPLIAVVQYAQRDEDAGCGRNLAAMNDIRRFGPHMAGIALAAMPEHREQLLALLRERAMLDQLSSDADDNPTIH